MGAGMLDPVTHHLFKNKVSQEFIPTLDVLCTFVQQRSKILENIRGVESSDTRYTKANRTLPSPQSALTIATQIKELTVASRIYSELSRGTKVQSSCSLCKDNHVIYRCQLFKKLTIAKRREFFSSNKLNYSCMNSSNLMEPPHQNLVVRRVENVIIRCYI